MSGEIDLSGEQDPTERMMEQQERARERADEESDLDQSKTDRSTAERSSGRLRESGHEGSVETDEFDLDDALEAL